MENEKKESFKRKLDNILFNLKWIAIVCLCVFVKILFDSANYEADNENKNDLENHLTINLVVNDSLGNKVIKVKSLKVGK